jgi:hypothetical protein
LLSQSNSCLRLKISVVVFIRKTKCFANTNKAGSPVKRAFVAPRGCTMHPSGSRVSVHLHSKYPNNLELSELHCKHCTPEAGTCISDSPKVALGLNDIQKNICVPNDRGTHWTLLIQNAGPCRRSAHFPSRLTSHFSVTVMSRAVCLPDCDSLKDRLLNCFLWRPLLSLTMWATGSRYDLYQYWEQNMHRQKYLGCRKRWLFIIVWVNFVSFLLKMFFKIFLQCWRRNPACTCQASAVPPRRTPSPWLFETGHIAQAGVQLMILLLQPTTGCWGYTRCTWLYGRRFI